MTKNRAFAPGLTDIKLLSVLARLETLTRPQLVRRLYSPNTDSTVKAHLTLLTRNGLLQMDALPRMTKGNCKGVWSLTDAGRRFLTKQGIPSLPSTHHTTQRTMLFLQHLLALNDFCIAVELLASRYEEIELVELRHERILRMNPPRARVGEEQMTVAPDAWADLRVNDSQVCVWLELDRSTEREKQFLRKIEAITSLAQPGGGYEAYFGTPAVRVAIVAVYGEHRRDQLAGWTEHALTKLKKMHWAPIFYLTGDDPAEVAPETFFCEPRFIHPFERLPVPLLEEGE